MSVPETVKLSAKQAEVVRLICEEGLTNREISERLGTSEQCVKNRLRDVLAAANVRDRLNLCIWYHTGVGPRTQCFPVPEKRQVVVTEEPPRQFVSAEEIRRRQEWSRQQERRSQ